MDRKYVVHYLAKDRKTGKYLQPRTMPSRQEVNAGSDSDAVYKFKESLAYKTHSGMQEWEVLRVVPK